MKSLSKISNLFILFYIVFNTIIILIYELGRYSTSLVIPLGFVFYFVINTRKVTYILKLKQFRIYLLFVFLAMISFFYAIYPNAAFETNKRLLIVFVFSITIFSFSLDSFKKLNIIYYGYLFSLIIMIIYVVRTGVNLEIGDRLGDDTVINANTYAYYIFNGLYSLFILYSQKERNNLFWIPLLCIVIGYSFYITLASASRGGFIIMILLLIGNIYLSFYKIRKGLLKKLILSVIIGFGLFYAGKFVFSNYLKDSLVIERFNQLEEEEESSRQYHLRKAYEIGLGSPIIGVGSGNYALMPKEREPGSFSHSSYAEAFANYGLLGFAIYLYFFYLIFRKAKFLLKVVDDETKILIYRIILYIFLFMIYNVFYVTYLTAEFTGMIFIILSHLILISRNFNNNKIQEYES
ncbi:MAG: O-antigen ligase family protein [Lutibacter sp.]